MVTQILQSYSPPPFPFL